MKEQTRQLRILWCSNGYFSPSGYANVTLDMFKNFREAGWTPDNFAFIDMYGLSGGKLKDSFGFTHYPLMDHVMGSDAMLHHGRDFKADIIIGLFDLWPQNPSDLAQITRFIPYVPVDYEPVPKPLLHNLRFANRIVSMSKFGQQQLQENGFSSTLIPHGVNTKIFYPMDKKKRKMEIGIDPNTFIFGMISANKEAVNPRKGLQQAMDAFKRFLEKKPNSLLYIHTDPDFPGGFPLKQYADFLGIAPRIAFPERYSMKYNTAKENMNLIYNTFDCLLSPSSTEGFCIPIIEAQACGVPCIVNDWTSMPELIIDNVTGYKIPVDPKMKIFYPIGSYIALADSYALHDKMMMVDDFTTDKWTNPARRWAVENFDQDMIFETRWLPFLNRIEKEIYGQTPQLTTLQA